ncbi:MAG: hypothetical protein V3V08_23380 [Nannocystaceae bacterium]
MDEREMARIRERIAERRRVVNAGLAIYGMVILLAAAFWGGVAYVAWHFISKWW